MQALPVQKQQVTRAQRVRLVAEELVVESRISQGDWRPTYAIPVNAIHTVYAYGTRDWAYLAVGAGYFLGLAAVVLTAALAARAPAATWLSALLLVLLLVGGVTAYRVAAVPLRRVRVDAADSALIFRRDDDLLSALRTRLPPLRETPESAPGEQPSAEI